MGTTRFQTDAMTYFDTLKSSVEKNGSTHPVVVCYPKNGEPFAIVCEMKHKDELEAICVQLRAVVKEFDIEAILWIATTGVILPKSGDATGMMYSVAVYQKDQPTWLYGWTYFTMEGTVEWVEEFCSDNKSITTQALELWS